jgi:hypothetical protein
METVESVSTLTGGDVHDARGRRSSPGRRAMQSEIHQHMSALVSVLKGYLTILAVLCSSVAGFRERLFEFAVFLGSKHVAPDQYCLKY